MVTPGVVLQKIVIDAGGVNLHTWDHRKAIIGFGSIK
jgi:hypothetical protein